MQLQTKPGTGDHRRDDACGCAHGGDGEHSSHAGAQRAVELHRGQPVFSVQERQRDLNEGCVHHRAHRRDVHREEHDDHHQRDQVVAESAEQPPARLLADLDFARAVAPGVDLDSQQDAQVVQDRRHDRPDQHGQVRHAEVLRDDERGSPQRRRRQDRADARRRQHSACVLLRVAGAAEDRPRHRAETDRRRRPRTRHRAQEESGQRHGPARRCARPPECRKGQVDEELAGARRVKHRTVNREQHDVRGRDIERHTVEAGRLDERRADDLVPVHSGMRDRGALRQIAAVIRVRQREQADDRQSKTGRSTAGLEHEQQDDGAHDDVDHRGSALPAEELVESSTTACEFEAAAPGTGRPPTRWRQAASPPASDCLPELLALDRRARHRRTHSPCGEAEYRSGSTAASAAAPPRGSRSARPGCPGRAERTPGRSRTRR